ncbi:MAG TPA: alpha-L-fucosidase [Armatimonadota bacterium]
MSMYTPSASAAAAQTASPSSARTAWFEDARFGLFIHWNACSALEGRFDGEPVRQTEYGEWLRARNRVPRKDWDAAVRQMHVTPEVVDGWAEAAKDAGMKYIIFVAKHHDGLAYWPSGVSDYTLNKLAGVNFDVIGELKRACDKRGLKLGFYYSHWQDWEDPYGWGNFWDYNSKDPKQFDGHDDFFFWGGEGYRDNLTPEQFNTYWRRKSLPQVEELVKRYQPAIMWFDCWRNLRDTNMTLPQVTDMLTTIRREDPNTIINSRLGIARVGQPDGTDYETLGDNEFPHQRIQHPWESAVTFGLTWGYSRDDQEWRPATYFIRNLVRNISLGGNLLINFGPQADGRPPQEALNCMHTIGQCLRANKEGFYGCGYTPFEERAQDWGLTTVDEAKNALYLHVFDWPVDGVIRVNGLKTKVAAATLCSTGKPITFQQEGQSVHITGPRSMPVPFDTVIRLNLSGPIEVDNATIGEINGGGIAMQAAAAKLVGAQQEKPYDGSTKLPAQIGGWTAPNAEASWTVFIPEAGKRSVTVSYACTVDAAGQGFTVSAGPGHSVSAKAEATQKNWSEFRPFTIGEIDFPSPGAYTITVRPDARPNQEPFKLLWVHLGEPGA